MFAVIGGVTGTLLERSIVIHMEKKPSGMQLRRTRERVIERDAKPLRRQLEAYSLQRRYELNDLYDKEPDEGYWPNITDREAEIWGPLLIHAKLAGIVAEMRLLAACDALTKQKNDIQAEDYHRALAAEIQDALEHHDGERFTPADLLGVLNGTENWGAKLAKYKEDDSKSKSSAIGRFLRKFRFKSRIHLRTGTSYLKAEALGVISSSTLQKSVTSITLSPTDGNRVKTKPVSEEAGKTPICHTSVTPSVTDGSDGEKRDLFEVCDSVTDVTDKWGGTGTYAPEMPEDSEIDPEEGEL